MSDVIACLLHRLANHGDFRRFIPLDRSCDGLEHPSIQSRRIIAPTADKSGYLELFDEHYRSGVQIQKQYRHRVSPLEHQPPLAGTHGAVDPLVRDDEFIDLEEIVEDATLLLNDSLTGHRDLQVNRHRTLQRVLAAGSSLRLQEPRVR